MTDEQIIKNAEYHKLRNCSRCDYKNHGSNCLHELLNDSIKMAKRLCEDVADLEEGYNDGIVCISRYKTENKWLLQKLQQAKSEAYKEFAKEVEEEIKKAYDNNSGVLREHLEKHKEKSNFEFVAAIQGKMNTLRGLDDFIDNLLKEMVGEEE